MRCSFLNKNSILDLSLNKRSQQTVHSQIYSGLSLIFAILLNFRVTGAQEFMCARRANIVFFYPIGKKKVTLGPLFRSKNDENRACVTKKYVQYIM